ncbi:metallophosphoesterase [Nocardioides sp. JQ2195]|uniref:metallophosphoesterase n=1 Tax=Nocardioides sp. JQ2195 TaxID=2592334 RepID=UPI00143EC37B|nr:metallophosphoesterase [Nocardioides sp. JQ2195]QIX28272.1 metallophosphoesterase [Nocardioides sp. JQ2195]
MSFTRILRLGALAGAATLGYAATEARAYTVRRVDLPVLPAGHAPLRVLHLSDIHMTPGQTKKQEWVRELSGLQPDLVINTGDNLAHKRAVPVVLDALGPLLEIPGAFVFGSNDYFAPTPRNPLRYLMPDNGVRATNSPTLPWRTLRDEFRSAGWADLTNTGAAFGVGGTSFGFVGVDDPHLSYDDLPAVAGPARDDVDVRLAVAHAPYLRVLDQFAADGYDAIIAGHTHGGQVCLPFIGALTTNCDLDTARAKGLHRHPADSAPGDQGSTWMHVSAGLGTNPYTRIRLACRPEATLLTLTPRG